MSWLKYIDKLSGWAAIAGLWMIPALAVTVFYDVIARYVFRAPTFWGYEISWMLYSASFLLGLSYALREGAHVRVDVLLNRFSPQVKASIELFFLVTMLFVFCGVAVWYGIGYASCAWKLKEGSHLTIWAPPIYPVKTLIPLCFLILGLQGIAEFVRRLQALKMGKPQ